MAEKLDTYDFKMGGKTKYNWDQYFDGGIWKLSSGEDFPVAAKSFRQTVYAAARRRGIKVHVGMPFGIDGEVVVIQKIKEKK